uniref:Zinc finger CCHC domain-containing protein 8 n=1 Tax=Paramormyrops kingsleyae TaxID=1676925 RepID=A0A3B3REM6_9TELE
PPSPLAEEAELRLHQSPNMAELDFGDGELFEQLEGGSPPRPQVCGADDGQALEELRQLRERLGEYEETIDSLIAENILELKRKLNILTRPSGINVENTRLDGPLLQILFANNDLSKQCRQEIEDYIFDLIKKHESQGKEEKEKASFHVKPQASSFVLEEKEKMTSGIRKIKDAFTVVGSVLYFTSFCLDKLGQPLLNENAQLTEGWEIPKYQQIFGQVISLDGQELQIKEKRPKSCCFNCGSEEHQLKDCTKPRDMNRINEKRKEFSQGNNQSNQRYHEEEVEERFGKYKPGIVSVELLGAMGVAQNSLPPFIYRMRQLGYPPGWLKEAEMENSGLALYDGKAEDEQFQRHKISYDVSKLIEFPGFNVSLPANITDEWRFYGSVPMQPVHLKHNFAAYLSKSFPTPGSNCSKRSHETDSTPRRSKKRRSDFERSSDMDVDSGHSRSSDNFQFQPPLPPGSPGLDTPPPLPRGTPPATPTPPPLPRGTPPATPSSSGSPALRGQAGSGLEDLAVEEDGLTLEELEEQQRLIWAALASADTATNSDSETPNVETPLISSSSASTPAQIDPEIEETMETERQLTANEGKDLSSPAPSDEVLVCKDKVDEDSCVTEVGKSEVHQGDVETAQGDVETAQGDVETAQGDVETAQGDVETAQDEPSQQMEAASPRTGKQSEFTGKVTSVPHRSKFAAGIIPFEDTPEYRDVAEATGVYLRIRDLLKSSPRSQTKNKK